MRAEQLELDYRSDDVVEAACGCACSEREVCPACRSCTGPHVGGWPRIVWTGCCRCLPAAAAPSSLVRKGDLSRTTLRRALVDTLAAMHAGGRA